MKHGAKIFLGDFSEPLEINEDFDLNMNFNFADAQEPTAVKNSWSRTVHLPATKINNRILGNIYDNTWVEGADNFNPNKRTDFKLYIDGILKMTGYVQLNTVNRDGNGIHSYELTFYGGLGDFFYNLATDEKTGETKKLSDLIWRVKTNTGADIEPDKEFDFAIDKDFVAENWRHLNNNEQDGTIHDFISFAPMYNGQPSSISADKVLINTYGDDTYNSISGKTYNGYVMAELSGKTDEWAARDLRSYLQRPVVKISKLMDAIADKRNNGGYEVNYDPTFFNENNVYYDKAYLTLPQLTVPDDYGVSGYTTDISSSSGNTWEMGGTTKPTYLPDQKIYFNSTEQIATESGGTILDISKFKDRSDVAISVKYKVKFTPKDKAASNIYDDLKMDISSNEATGIRINVYAYDAETGKMVYGQDLEGRIISDGVDVINAGGQLMKGHFVKQQDGTWEMEDLFSTFNIKIPQATKKIRLTNSLTKWMLNNALTTYGLGRVMADGKTKWFDGIFEITATGYFSVGENKKVKSGTEINKQILFNSENDNSVLDFLLSYTKRFGIVWTKDKTEKKIYAWKRDTFYTKGADINLADYIDYSQETKIKPLNFDYRFYAFRDLENDNYYSKLYKKKYSKEYGQKRADTNYPFSDETTEMTANSIFQEIPEVNVNAEYNRRWYTIYGDNIGSWVNNAKNTLISFDTANTVTKSFDFRFDAIADGYIWYSANQGNDWTHRPSCAGEDNAAGSLDYTLLFFNGSAIPQDANKNKIPYWLSDDVDEMYTLGGGSPTFLQTNSNFDKSGNDIAYRLTELPYFSRWITDGDTITDSWDWGTPVELFVRGMTQGEDANLYGNFWKKYLGDQFSVNSRTLTCHVDLRKLNPEWMMLGNRFYFENSIWVLSEINDYNEMAEDTTECVFIKVLDLNNYTDGQVLTD